MRELVAPLAFRDAHGMFDIEILPDAVLTLVEEALSYGYRVYELMKLQQLTDLWGYLWVAPAKRPAATSDSSGLTPFEKFSRGIYDDEWDPDARQMAWYAFFNGVEFTAWSRSLLAMVLEAQRTTQSANDCSALVYYDAQAWRSQRHPDGSNFRWKPEHRCKTIMPPYDEAGRAFLAAVVAHASLDSVREVAFRGVGELPMFAALCTVQQQRAQAAQCQPQDALGIYALTPWEKPHHCESEPKWLADGVTFMSEGLRRGDLTIEDQPASMGLAMTELLAQPRRQPQYVVLGYETKRPIEAYSWTIGGGISVGVCRA